MGQSNNHFVWHLECEQQSLILSSEGLELPEIVYWGPKLNEGAKIDNFYSLSRVDYSGGSLDKEVPVSICPLRNQGFLGYPGLKIRDKNHQNILPDFKLDNFEHLPGILKLVYKDEHLKAEYKVSFVVNFNSDVIVCDSEVSFKNEVFIEWLAAPVFRVPDHLDLIWSFSGRWGLEFQIKPSAWKAGIYFRDNNTGRSGHEHFPALLVSESSVTNNSGEVYFLTYGYAGGHRMVAEEMPDGRRQVQFGHSSFDKASLSKRSKSAPLYIYFSDSGFNKAAVAMQRHVKEVLYSPPAQPIYPKYERPVHYNSWEGVYFNHDIDKLCLLAEKAAYIGVERFVLDDGWFTGRTDDKRALGDWSVDMKRYPKGLDVIIDKVHSLKMSFGIWFEPEMVSPDSDLFKKNPDWILGSAQQIKGRNQLVLDLCNSDVLDYLYTSIYKILNRYYIEYIKWDHNRVLPLVDHNQMEALFSLVNRLKKAFPYLEIESCASGGGRADFGILSRFNRVWLSDNNDALERVKLQHNSSLFLPSFISGSHVGPKRSHQTGRVLDLKFKAWTSASRSLGFEMDLNELNQDELNYLKEISSFWKDNRRWLLEADVLHLDSSDSQVIAEQHLSVDKSKFMLYLWQLDSLDQIAPKSIRMCNLNPNLNYKLKIISSPEYLISNGRTIFKQGSLIVNGAYLMHNGLNFPILNPASVLVIKGELVIRKNS